MSTDRDQAHDPRHQNVRPIEQLLSVAAGACLLRAGWRSRGLGGLLQLSLGAALAWRGAQGYCAVYDVLESGSRSSAEPKAAAEWREARCSLAIGRPAKELYQRWRDLEKLPEILSHVKEVRVLDERRSHWVVTGPAGARFEFDSRIQEDVPDSRIAWRSEEDAEVRNEGAVEFHAESGNATRVTVRLRYLPPAGRLGQLAAKIFGASPEQQLADDLLRFKRRMEEQGGKSSAAAAGAAATAGAAAASASAGGKGGDKQ